MNTSVLNQVVTEEYSLYHADTVDIARLLPDNTMDFSVFSPPFSSLFVYSNSPRDLGNVRTDEEFFEHFQWLVKEQYRAMRPGRIIAIHCSVMPTTITLHGHIGLRDFRGNIIRAYEKEGFIYHSEVTIWKDPVMQMHRTKAMGLLHKQIKKDSTMCRQGLADYLVMMRKPGKNNKPVSHTAEELPVEVWQRYASPVWATADGIDDDGFVRYVNPNNGNPDKRGIVQNDTLQHTNAKEHEDEPHLCALQLEVIRRAIKLWSTPGDIVWSPFMGIGSEGYVAIQEGRRFVGAELKKSYFEHAVRNLANAKSKQQSLFANIEKDGVAV